MSAMVETSGSPLVRRVGRILGERVAPGASAGRAVFGVSVCALLALAGIAPRVSVASPALRDRITYFRTVVDRTGVMEIGDSAVVFGRGRPRMPSTVFYRRVSIERTLGDSVASGRVSMRR
jgi:hypothetical protein